MSAPASWKKVIVSGSQAQLNQLSVDTEVNITGSLNASGSVYLQGLVNNPASYIVSINTVTGQLSYQGTGSFTANSASYAITASYANTATSASHADNSDNAVSASYASNSDNAISASYALSASNAATASSVNTLNQAVVISGSLSVNTSTGNSFDINADTFIFTGSFNQTGSVFLTGLTEVSKSYVVGYNETTGQLTYQTAVDNAATASFAVSASYAISASNAISASYSSTATSASHADNADSSISSSYAATASYALNVPTTASNANTASYAFFAVSASHADNADNSISSSYAVSSSQAATADLAYAVTGSSTLTSGSIVLWDGAAFANSSITQNTGTVLINNAGGVTIQAGGLYVTGSSTFHDNVVIQGDLTVAGTASFQNSTNLAIADQFILLNSGSTTFQDSGIVINTGNSGNSGSAFFLETAGTTTGSPLNGRFAVAGSVPPDATSVTAQEYANTTLISGSAPNGAVPQFGGTGLGQGNMWVNSSTGDIYIYA